MCAHRKQNEWDFPESFNYEAECEKVFSTAARFQTKSLVFECFFSLFLRRETLDEREFFVVIFISRILFLLRSVPSFSFYAMSNLEIIVSSFFLSLRTLFLLFFFFLAFTFAVFFFFRLLKDMENKRHIYRWARMLEKRKRNSCIALYVPCIPTFVAYSMIADRFDSFLIERRRWIVLTKPQWIIEYPR